MYLKCIFLNPIGTMYNYKSKITECMYIHLMYMDKEYTAAAEICIAMNLKLY